MSIYGIKRSEAEKRVKAEAKSVGLVLKRQRMRIGGEQAYMLVDRETREVVMQGGTFSRIYQFYLQNGIKSYSKEIRAFSEI